MAISDKNKRWSKRWTKRHQNVGQTGLQLNVFSTKKGSGTHCECSEPLIFLAGGPGFEPGQHDPESWVLPLHNPPAMSATCIIIQKKNKCKIRLALPQMNEKGGKREISPLNRANTNARVAGSSNPISDNVVSLAKTKMRTPHSARTFPANTSSKRFKTLSFPI